MKTDRKILTIPDFMLMLIAIDSNPGLSISELHIKTQMTYSHLHYIKKMLVSKGWITITLNEQKHIPNLTVEGQHITRNILVLIISMGITVDDVWKWKQKEKKVPLGNTPEDKPETISSEVSQPEEEAVTRDEESVVSEDRNKQKDEEHSKGFV